MATFSYHIKFVMPCTPGSTRVRVIAELNCDSSELLPYCHAVIKHSYYNPDVKSLITKVHGRPVIITGSQVIVGQLPDPDLATEILEEIVIFLEKIMQARDKITPLYQPRTHNEALAIYRLLPRINCRKCNEHTCLAFAFALWRGEQIVENCPHLTPDKLQAIHSFLAEEKNIIDYVEEYLIQHP